MDAAREYNKDTVTPAIPLSINLTDYICNHPLGVTLSLSLEPSPEKLTEGKPTLYLSDTNWDVVLNRMKR